MAPRLTVVLSGAGLSAASGVPTFRGAGGLWEGYDVQQVATPEAWERDPDLVRRFYDARRTALEGVRPNPGHDALVRLQDQLGPHRVVLVTQNIDGLLGAAGAKEVLEIHGALRSLRCERDEDHPWVPVAGPQDPEARCGCGGRLRPAVVWFGEVPRYLERVFALLQQCDLFVSVGTSGLVYPAAGFVRVARAAGAQCIDVNPEPTPGAFQRTIAEPAEVALPRLVEELLG